MNPLVYNISQLSSTQQHQMHGLLNTYFQGVSREQFDADLRGKTHALLIRDQNNTLVGFSTFALYRGCDPDQQAATIVCSGDTIVAPQAWNSTALPSAWVAAVHELHVGIGTGKLYWLLITSGFRTYRFLPVFIRQFFPCYREPTPVAIEKWMRQLAGQRWGHAYDAEKGIVRFEQPQPLRTELAEVPASRILNPHVAFFLERNPGHARGDELVCIADLSEENLNPAGRRMLASGRQRGLTIQR